MKCDGCKKDDFKEESLYRFTWRYNDKKRTYIGSGRKIIHTGYAYLCNKCLHELVGLLN